jgi:hypothetical protein
MKFRLSSFCIHNDEQLNNVKKRLIINNIDGSQNGLSFMCFMNSNKYVMYFKDSEFFKMSDHLAKDMWDLWNPSEAHSRYLRK